MEAADETYNDRDQALRFEESGNVGKGKKALNYGLLMNSHKASSRLAAGIVKHHAVV